VKDNATDISVVLDRSGSMSVVKPDTIGGFNTFLKDQKAAPGEARLTLAQFDTEYEIVHDGKPIGDVPDLNDSTFVPRGNTALLDAIGRTINATGKRLSDMPEADRPAKVVFVIITDGQENSSREFTVGKVNEMISHQRNVYGWQFIFLGANQDAIATAAAYGIAKGSSLTYAANSVGTQALFASASSNVRTFRAGTNANASFTDEDRKKQQAAGASN